MSWTSDQVDKVLEDMPIPEWHRRMLHNDLIKRFQPLEDAARDVMGTMEVTGGVRETDKGYEPIVDSEWTDLGDAYVSLCTALGEVPYGPEE